MPDAKRLRALEAENAKLRKLLAEAMLDNEAFKVIVRGNTEPAGATRRRRCRAGYEFTGSERRAFRVLGLSRSVLHYASQHVRALA